MTSIAQRQFVQHWRAMRKLVARRFPYAVTDLPNVGYIRSLLTIWLHALTISWMAYRQTKHFASPGREADREMQR